jgi:hypothetical protein
MPNPMKGWKLGGPKAREVPEDVRMLTLMKPPVMEDGELTSIVSVPIKEGRYTAPNLVGKMVSWESSSYEIAEQWNVSDTQTIRELDYRNRLKRQKYAYLRVILKEADDFFALMASVKRKP